ncbi:hypothetical protein ACFL7D_05515 [candidate division KSB1 bacterium]
MKKYTILYMTIFCVLGFIIVFGCSQAPPETAEEVIERSVKAHGSEKLTNWSTKTILGTVVMNDGNFFNSAYRLYVEKPGKLREEIDQTVDKGRIFTEEFLNDGVAWRRQNLMVRGGNVGQSTKKLEQCSGIAYYADKAEALLMKGEAEVEWKECENNNLQEFNVVDTKLAYVVAAVMGADTTELYFDKDNYYLILEKTGRSAKAYHDFKKVNGVVHAAKMNMISFDRRGNERIAPYKFETIEYNKAIDPKLFTEDMPAKQ